MAQATYDRTVEDLGNCVGLEHVNVTVPDQSLATLFYITGLGLTRDPYLMTGLENMWVNVGRSQFHLPSRGTQVLRGRTGIVLPDREALLARLASVRKRLEGTCFAFSEHEAHVDAVCPWGNRIRCHAPHPRFGRVTIGMPYVEMEVPVGTADGIARFFREIIGAPASVADDSAGRYARVMVGDHQNVLYRETDAAQAPYDGHHLQVYVVDFSGPHRRLAQRGLVTEESDQHQYRFRDIVDVDSGKVLFTLEHEVRSLRHPLYARPLVNRNPAQTNLHYAPGHDGWIPGMAHAR